MCRVDKQTSEKKKKLRSFNKTCVTDLFNLVSFSDVFNNKIVKKVLL